MESNKKIENDVAGPTRLPAEKSNLVWGFGYSVVLKHGSIVDSGKTVLEF